MANGPMHVLIKWFRDCPSSFELWDLPCGGGRASRSDVRTHPPEYRERVEYKGRIVWARSNTPVFMRSFFTVALVIAGGVLAKDANCHFKLKETVPSPRGWVNHGIPKPDHNINLRIGLPQPNFGLLEQHLYEVSDPFHERYGQHLSKEEVEALVAPHQESINSVDKWLATFGIKESDIQRSPGKDWVKLRIPVALAEEMLNTVCFDL
jgi:tripeptidyl-peptidase-1